MLARLVPLDDSPPIDLTRDVTLVGRSADCDARIDHKSISKLHCLLVQTDGLVLVRDLGSTNGTRVNGQRVRRAALLPNDSLAVAAFRYTVRFGDPADANDAAAALVPAPDRPDGSGDHPAGPDPVKGPAVKRNALPDAV